MNDKIICFRSQNEHTRGTISDRELKPRLPVEVVLHQDRYDTSRCAADVDAYDEQIEAYYQARSSQQKNSNCSEQTAAAV